MKVEHMNLLCLCYSLINPEKRKLLRIYEQCKSTDSLTTVNDPLLLQQTGYLTYIACICTDAFRYLI